MRARAVSGPLRETAGGYARIRFRTAVTFLDWADARGIPLKDLRQADVDAFYIGHLTCQQQAIRDFITWAVRHGHLPRVEVPVMRFAKGPGITQAERLALIKRFVTSDELHPHLRTAACLMLLYAQPLSRVLRLTPGDVLREGGTVSLLLGNPPSPVPEPFASMLEELAAACAGKGWLFPGTNPRQPRDYRSFYIALHQAGLPMRDVRTTALRQLVTQAPAPVVADALGFHQTTTTRQFTAAGGTWSRYAATRRPPRTDAGRQQQEGSQ